MSFAAIRTHNRSKHIYCGWVVFYQIYFEVLLDGLMFKSSQKPKIEDIKSRIVSSDVIFES